MARIPGDINGAAAKWDNLYTKAPDKVTNFLGEVIKDSGKYFKPAAEIAGGGWVATKAGEEALKLLQGKDAGIWHASTSTTDRAVGTTVMGLASLVGAGMSVHGAIKILANIQEDMNKK